MCGISGIWSGNKINCNAYYDAHMQIKHRGPDDEGFTYLNDNEVKFAKGDDTIAAFQELPHIRSIDNSGLVFGHRRLSILDLSEKGHQPMLFEHLSIIFNGEIFNFKDIRNELTALGYHFNSNTDTEVVLKGYHCWGDEILNKIDGMWAMAIYDHHLKQLFLSRDNFGIKPLYYSLTNSNTLLFSSEVKFITGFNPDLKKPNSEKLNLFLNHLKQDVDEETFFKDIFQVKPGSSVLIDSNFRFTKKQYYFLNPGNLKLSKDDIYERLIILLNQSLKSRLLSDVKVGSLLSGGLDSNFIVSNLSKQNIINKENFEAFSAVYNDNSKIDEFDYVEATRKKYDIKVHYIKPEISDLNQVIDKLLFHIEGPFRSLSVFAQMELYKKIRNESQVRVVMNGQGSDEIFGGYHHHLLYGLGENFGSFHIAGFLNNFKFINFKMNINHYKMLTKYCISGVFGQSYFNSQLRKEVSISPLPEYLKYDDRTSMAYGIEARPPFLSKDLVDFALNIPLKYKIKEGQGKYILRDISKGTVADEILQRKDKLGFVTPQETWMQSNLKEDILQTLKQFNFEENNLASHQTMTLFRDGFINNTMHWQKVWQYYIMAKWYSKWIE